MLDQISRDTFVLNIKECKGGNKIGIKECWYSLQCGGLVYYVIYFLLYCYRLVFCVVINGRAYRPL